MDLSKVFDVIQHDLLLAKLKAYGVDEGSCALLKDYLSGRQQRVKIGDTISNWAGTILLSIVNLKSLFIRRLQNFMITLYKSLFFTNYPGYLKDMFTVRSSSYNLRGNHILALPNPKTTTYGLHSFSYLASKIWNSLPDT